LRELLTQGVVDGFEEVLEPLVDAVVDLMLEQDVGRLGLLVEGLQQSCLVDLGLGLLLLQVHQVLEGHGDGDALAVAEQSGSSVEEAADFSPLLVVLDPRCGDAGDDPIVVLEPVLIDLDADLIVAVHSRRSLVDHHSPQEVGLVVALLLQLLESFLDGPHLPLHLLDSGTDLLNFLLDVERCGIELCLSELVIDLFYRRYRYMWFRKERRFLAPEVPQSLTEIVLLALDFLDPG
jgi:hypothetical protein